MVIFYAEQKNKGCLGPNLAQNGAFGHYLNFDSSDSSDIAHSHCWHSCLVLNNAYCS
jgi:hypothetical protein